MLAWILKPHASDEVYIIETMICFFHDVYLTSET